MSNTAIKKVSIQNSQSTFDTRDFGAEAQDIDISYDSNGDIIEDINAAGVEIATTGKLTTALKGAQTALAGKASATALASKASLINGKIPMSLLPDYVDDVIEGYYNTENGKFYREDTYQTEIQGQAGKIYVDLNTNTIYRWSGSVFVEIINLSELDIEDLSDVDINNLQDGQALVYDSNAHKWVNGNAALHIVKKPTVTVGTYTYNGQPQGPDIEKSADFDTYVETENATAVNAGTYTLRFKLKNIQTYKWDDLTTADITYTYTINKAAGDVTFDENSITLDDEHLTATVNITSKTGDITSVVSSDEGIATVLENNDVITVTATGETGIATITVTVTASDNYLAASRTISVTADFIKMVSWSTGTEAEITEMINAYYSGKKSLDQIQEVWHVGDSRSVNLSAMNATGVGESHRAQTVEMIILDFDHDLLVNSSGSKTKALVTLGQKNCLRDANVSDTDGSNNTENGYINDTDINSTGWSDSKRRIWCNSVYYNALPNYLKPLVKRVKKSTATTGNTTSPTWYANYDYCFLPSEWEVFGAKYSSAETGQDTSHNTNDGTIITMPAGGTQYSWYTTAENRRKLPIWMSTTVTSDIWWLRSPFAANSSSGFCLVNYYGSYAYLSFNRISASYTNGIAPHFCL